jgi:integrase
MSAAKRRVNAEGSNPRQRLDGRWQINIRVTDADGVSKRMSVLGRTAEEARRKTVDLRRRLEDGQPVRDAKETTGSFAQRWIESTLAASDRKPATKSLYATLARKHIIDGALGRVALDRLRLSHVDAFVVELRGKGLAESTVRSVYTVLRAVLDGAVRDGALGRNPAALVKRPKVTTKEAAHLGTSDVKALVEAMSGSRYQSLVELLVSTGLRRGEALALRWTDIDQDRNVIRVRGTLGRIDGELVVSEPKTAKSKRIVPMSPAVTTLLRRSRVHQQQERLRAGSQWTASGFVFTTDLGEPCDPRNALRAVKAAAKRAGLDPAVGLHTLRHSAATVMLTNGVPIKVVSDVLGHSSIAITGDVYGHVTEDVAREALAALSTAFGA